MGKKVFLFFIFAMYWLHSIPVSGQITNDKTGWKAGVASITITPVESMWLAGYGGRDRPSDGVVNDLWIKALALEDIDGNRSVLVTMDLEELPKIFSDRIRVQLERDFHLSKAQIILNVSHTHSSPVLENFEDIYPLDSDQIRIIKDYTTALEKKIIALVGKAMESMEPVQIYSGQGVSRFQVNRRNNKEATLNLQTELKGPNDYSVPVLKIVNSSDKILAVAFGYACHPTTLSGYKWSGDYAGFAQSELEKIYPGTTALFFQGCGGDQNPLPRRTISLAEQYGKTLAAAVEQVLNEKMSELSPQLFTSYREIELPLATPPSKEELSILAKKYSSYQKRWALRQLDKLNNGESLMTSYPYPIQIWKLGEQSIMAMGGEVMIEYAIQLKRMYGQDLFVMGYCNDVMAYIPSTTVLSEGGYEGASSVMTTDMPSTWGSEIETTILSQMARLADESGVMRIKSETLNTN